MKNKLIGVLSGKEEVNGENLNEIGKTILVLCVISWIIILGTALFYKEPVERYEPYYWSTCWSNIDINDTDNDGVSDFEELHIYHTNPFFRWIDGYYTNKSDDVSDNTEYLTGSDPNNTSAFVLSNHNLLFHWWGYKPYTAYEMPMWVLPIAYIHFVIWTVIMLLFRKEIRWVDKPKKS